MPPSPACPCARAGSPRATLGLVRIVLELGVHARLHGVRGDVAHGDAVRGQFDGDGVRGPGVGVEGTGTAETTSERLLQSTVGAEGDGRRGRLSPPPAPSWHGEALPLARGDAYTPRRIFIPPPKKLRRLVGLLQALGGLRGLTASLMRGPASGLRRRPLLRRRVNRAACSIGGGFWRGPNRCCLGCVPLRSVLSGIYA